MDTNEWQVLFICWGLKERSKKKLDQKTSKRSKIRGLLDEFQSRRRCIGKIFNGDDAENVSGEVETGIEESRPEIGFEASGKGSGERRRAIGKESEKRIERRIGDKVGAVVRAESLVTIANERERRNENACEIMGQRIEKGKPHHPTPAKNQVSTRI